MSLQVDSLILCLLLTFISHSHGATSNMETKLAEQIITHGNATETNIADLKNQNEATEKLLSDVLIKLSRLEESLNTSASTCNMERQRREAQSDLAELKLQNKATDTELKNVFRKLFMIVESMNSSGATSNMETKLVEKIIEVNTTETSIADLKNQNEATEKQLSDVLIKLSRLEESLNTSAPTCNMEIQRREAQSDLSELKLQNKATDTELKNVLRKLFTIEESMNYSATSDMQTKLVEQIIAQVNATETSIADLKNQNKVTEKLLSDVLIKLSGLEESLNTSASTCNMEIQRHEVQSDLSELKLQNKATDTQLKNVSRKLFTIEESMNSSATSDMQTKLVEQIIAQGNATETSIADLKNHNEVTEKQLSDMLIKLSRLEESLNTSASTCNMEIQRSEAESDLSELKLQNKATDTELKNVLRKLFTIEESMNSSATIMNQLLEMTTQIKTYSDVTESKQTAMKTEIKILFQGQLTELRTDVETLFNNVLEQLSRLETVLNSSLITVLVDTVQIKTQIKCEKGMSSPKPRQKFLLWGQIEALCDTETDGGGWIVIQRRTKGDIDFYRGWNDYKNGFGTPDTDFWIGNYIIHNLTSQGYTELRIDLEYEGREYFAHYFNFSLASELLNYKITVGEYTGTAGDSLKYHNGASLSTPDRDNDGYDGGNCATLKHGVWWYVNCFHSNLNGRWVASDDSGVMWLGIGVKYVSFTEMKVRRI